MRIDTFLSELRRRRVGRVAVAYAIAAWALIQVADVVLPRLAFPEWTVTLLIVVSIALFPVALVLAWIYDVVPTDDADASDRPTGIGAASRRPARRWIGAAVVVTLLLIATAVTTRVWSGLADASHRLESIAVLPFENLSSDAEQDYFAAGMHDALITELAQIGAVRVLSRKSTLRYKHSEKSMAEIARELGVEGLVEATVLKIGGDVRMQVQLIRPLPRERHVWAASYERSIEDVQRLHGDIARTIADEIGARLTPDESARLTSTRRVDPRAYEAYLRGMYFLSRQTPDDYRIGLRHLQEAVALDPGDPDAHAALALGYSVIGHATIPDAFERAKSSARRALLLDSTVAAAHEALAEIALYRDWDFDQAERSFRHALALNPNLAEASGHYAWYLALRGRDDDALGWMHRAASLDPLNALWPAWAGWLHLWSDAPDSALALGRLALELAPDHPHALVVAGSGAALTGDVAEAERIAAALESIPPYRWGAGSIYAALGQSERARELAADIALQPSPMNAFGLALIHAQLGQDDTALDWLERAAELRFSWMPWIHRATELKSLRGNPRFEALVERVGIREPPLQLAV